MKQSPLFWICITLLGLALPFREAQAQSSDFSKGWLVVSSADITADGALISTEEFSTSKGYSTEMPATVMAVLNRHNVFGDLFVGDRLNDVDKSQFQVPWWYRKTFTINKLSKNDHYQLRFEGINYKANVWLNGKLLASSKDMEGVFRMFDYDVDTYVKEGTNVLAVEIIPPAEDDLTIGFVDWNPWPPDNNMGIWRPVTLAKTGAVELEELFIKTDLDTETLDKASIEIVANLRNFENKEKSGVLSIEFDGKTIEHNFTLKSLETKIIVLNAAQHPSLQVKSPRIWWPINMGDPNLYDLGAKVTADGKTSDARNERFGIRKVEDYFNVAGHRGYKINGKEVLIKGGGWVDDLFLDDSDEKVIQQIQYVKHMNLNTVRLEGFWGRNQTIFNAADELGILVMIGWSCQWEWKDYCGREEDEYLAIRTDKEIAEHAQAYQDQVEWIRNHPSVFLYVYGSDKLLVPKLEQKLNAMISTTDGTRPILNSCGGRVSEVTGKSGVKMNGPYSYVTPNYWYVDNSRGGAFGFNTETGPGIQIAPIESIQKMIPKENLWPIDNVWGYHLGRREFTTYKYWMRPFQKRYGMPDDVNTFALKAQMANYEAMRPMFESFHVNRPNTTGIIQWMLNSAWPAMIWQLYDYYLLPNAAFYATKNACRPLNAVYHYGDQSIYVTDTRINKKAISLEVSIYDANGQKLFGETKPVNPFDTESLKVMTLSDIDKLPETYFLDLRLKDDKGADQAINFYWLSNKEDVLDLENSQWFVTENKSFASFNGINQMKSATVNTNTEFIQKSLLPSTSGRGEKQLTASVTLENTSDQIAFFIELAIKDKDGNTVLPVFWDDNYISLLPGEKRTISGYITDATLTEGDVKVELNGWNLK